LGDLFKRNVRRKEMRKVENVILVIYFFSGMMVGLSMGALL
jgi:hypothetical protein